MFARGLALFALLAAIGAGVGSCAPPPAPPVLQQSAGLPSQTPVAPAPPVAGLPERSGPAVSFAIRDAAALRKEYGKPDFVRSEANSELWRYDGTNCALFLFLYRENDSFLLRHMETLPRGAQSATDEACVASVKARFSPAS